VIAETAILRAPLCSGMVSGVLSRARWQGFFDIRFHQEASFDSGILWQNPWSLPLAAIAG